MPNRIIRNKSICSLLCGLSIMVSASACGGDKRIAAKANGAELLGIAVQPYPAQGQAGPCENQPIYKQFDFWLGEWDVKQTQDEKGASVGVSRIEKLTGGCAILNRTKRDWYN